jgi:hypothetical protein
MFDYLPLTIACSGPGAARVIANNTLIGYIAAGFGTVIVLVIGYDWIRRNTSAVPLGISCAALLLHPAWTVSAIQGDCGYLKYYASLFFTGIFVALAIAQFLLTSYRASEADKPTPRLQFSVRGLLILTTIVALVLGGIMALVRTVE